MKASFENTVNILVKAYLNDTLEHLKCSACAVGNLVAAADNTTPRRYPDNKLDGMGLKFDCWNWANNRQVAWYDVFMTTGGTQRITPELYSDEAKRQIDVTGYAWEELARIEYAFETAPKGKDNDEWMFNGLMAVVDVLADIHQVDLSVKESAKLLFVKA